MIHRIDDRVSSDLRSENHFMVYISVIACKIKNTSCLYYLQKNILLIVNGMILNIKTYIFIVFIIT